MDKNKIRMQKEAEAFDREIMRKVLGGADVNTADEWGNTFLHKAVDNGTLRLVKFLVKRGANVNAENLQGWTPLHNAVAHKEVSVRRDDAYHLTKYLLDHGADIKATILNQDNPLHLAAWFNDTRLVRLLIDRGADVCEDTGEHGTPLQTAYYFRKIKTIRYLEHYFYRKKMEELKEMEKPKKLTGQRRKISANAFGRQR